MRETEERLRKVLVASLGVEPEKVTDASTMEELGADSLDLVELEMAIEDEWGVRFPDGELDKGVLKLAHTVPDVVAIIEAQAA